jgi:hypothetical protein
MIMLGNRGEASSSSAPQWATPTTKQSKPDAEEEISIEDIPF